MRPSGFEPETCGICRGQTIGIGTNRKSPSSYPTATERPLPLLALGYVPCKSAGPVLLATLLRPWDSHVHINLHSERLKAGAVHPALEGIRIDRSVTLKNRQGVMSSLGSKDGLMEPLARAKVDPYGAVDENCR